MLVLIIFPEIIIDSLFKRGEFNSYESKQTVLALLAYSLGIPFFVISKSCQSVFLAAGATKKIMYISLLKRLD